MSNVHDHILSKTYHVELLPPKQNSERLEKDLDIFGRRYERTLKHGYVACITDNAMGNLSFQGTEMIEELELPVESGKVVIHLNTFHTKENLHEILDACQEKGIKDLLVVSGDGSDRLPKLQPAEVGFPDVESVTSVELLKYIDKTYPGVFDMGVAFNPYEPEHHEFEKMDRKLEAGAQFVITQPVIEHHPVVDKLLEKVDLPVVVECWMSKKLHLLSEAVGYEIPEDTEYDPVDTLKKIHSNYPKCGVYLALLGFKTQFPLLTETWVS